MVKQMNIMLSELNDFKTIRATVQYDNEKDKHHPSFLARIGDEELICEIKKTREHGKLQIYELTLPFDQDIGKLREKFELILITTTKKVSKSHVKKTKVIDYYAYKVDGISFFPQADNDKTLFRLFSPLAKWVRIKLFDGEDAELFEMDYDERGFWTKTFDRNLHLREYRYVINIEGKIRETIDPFSLSLTINSQRSVVIDETSLENMDDQYENPKNPCDCIIYETHIRDFTSDPSVGFEQRNTYDAFCQKNITIENGLSVGFDHLKELGVTHVHILPIQDFKSVNDAHKSDYNWGYDPLCYTVPEGSYASDPADPISRIDGVRKMVKTLHEHSLGLILDVVYNHTYEQEGSIFNCTIPDHAYRWSDYGELSNGSGCGNEIDTERPFMRKYIIDSLRHWIHLYNVDGFRFDLMGLMDTATMHTIEEELGKEKDLILYGEPWTGGLTVLPEEKRSTKGFQRGHRIAVFNDDLRNAIKGFPDDDSRGFISSQIGWSDQLLGSMLGAIGYEDDLLNIADNPCEQIAYNSCHDNLTLFDKIKKSCPEKDWNEWLSLNRLAAFIVVLTQGIVFLHSGEEFARTKHMHHNTYNLGDVYNTIKWHNKAKYYDLYEYYKRLIEIRKNHNMFRLAKKHELLSRVNLIHRLEGAFAFTIDGRGIDSWKHCVVAVNMTDEDLWFKLPELATGDGWNITVNKYQAGDSVLGIANKELQLSEKSWYLLYI